MTTSQADRAARLRALHGGDPVLVLFNAWDVASARVAEAAGAAAIATTSAGVAWSLGAADGDQLDRDRALDLVARVAAAVDVPVTADIESGFGADAAGVAETVRGVIAAGAVGINLEDAGASEIRPVQEQTERIAAARGAADDAGIALFVNARIDVFLRAVGDPADRLAHTLDRAKAYLAAGADGIFVPGTTDADTVAALARGIAAPLNVLAGPGAPSVGELARLGVARVSVGSAIAQAAYDVMRRAARELLDTGTYTALERVLDYGALNSLLREGSAIRSR